MSPSSSFLFVLSFTHAKLYLIRKRERIPYLRELGGPFSTTIPFI